MDRFLKPKSDAIILSGFLVTRKRRVTLFWALKWVGLFCMVLAFSSPILKTEIFPYKKPAHGIMLLLDISASMGQGSKKLEIAKKVGSEFIQKRKNDHVGMVAFADFAFIGAPLTFDLQATSNLLKRLKVGMAGRKTALKDGLFMTIRLLKRSKAKEKIIILLTDGKDNSSQTSNAMIQKMIKTSGVKIYTIGIGKEGEFDKNFLLKIAKISKGEFYQAFKISNLNAIYKKIESLEKSEIGTEKIVQKDYYFAYPLFISLICFMLMLYAQSKGGRV